MNKCHPPPQKQKLNNNFFSNSKDLNFENVHPIFLCLFMSCFTRKSSSSSFLGRDRQSSNPFSPKMQEGDVKGMLLKNGPSPVPFSFIQLLYGSRISQHLALRCLIFAPLTFTSLHAIFGANIFDCSDVLFRIESVDPLF